MHGEIQIKQFPIVTTHWWPKTRNEQFVWENEQYLYRFLPLVHNHVQVIWVRTHIRCVTCVRALWLTLHSHGASASTLDRGRVWSVVLTRRHSYNNQSHTSMVLHERDWVFAWGDLIGWRLHWRLKSCVSTTLQTRPPSSVDADAPCCLIWISLCMFFFPLIETVTYTCHYMTDRLERFHLKTSKLDLLKKKRHLHLGCPWGKLIDTKF